MLAVALGVLYVVVGLATVVALARLLLVNRVADVTGVGMAVFLIVLAIAGSAVTTVAWPLLHLWLMWRMWREKDLDDLLRPGAPRVALTTLVTETEMRVALLATRGREVTAETVTGATVEGTVATARLNLPLADAPRTATLVFVGDRDTEHEVTRVRNGHELILVGL